MVKNLVELRPDSIWATYGGTDSYDSFCTQMARPFVLSPALPEFLREELEITNKLLRHSYFEPGFVNIALLQMVVGLEKVMKHRYSEIHQKAFKGTMESLIRLFSNEGYFEFSTAESILNVYRQIRNSQVHDLRSTGGLVFIYRIHDLVFFINDLYEDLALRKERKRLTEEIQSHLKRIVEEGAVIQYENKREIIFDAHVLFANNKKTPYTITFVFWPIFDPAQYRDANYIRMLSPVVIEAISLDISEKQRLRATTTRGEITLDGNMNGANKDKYTQWSSEVAELPNAQLAMQVKTSTAEHEYLEAIRSFYRG